MSGELRTGEACYHFSGNEHQSFKGALRVVDFLLKQVSVNREKDLWKELYSATSQLYDKTPAIRPIIEAQTGIIVPKERGLGRWRKVIIKNIVNIAKKISG